MQRTRSNEVRRKMGEIQRKRRGSKSNIANGCSETEMGRHMRGRRAKREECENCGCSKCKWQRWKIQLTTWKLRWRIQRLSEARELRGIRLVLQSLTEICTGNNEQSAIFRSTVDRFEPSVEGGALGFRGLRGLQ